VVRAFGRQAHEMGKFDEQNEENRKRQLKVKLHLREPLGDTGPVCGIEIALIMIVGIILTVNGSLSIGQFTAFSSYVFLFFWPIRGFGRVLNHFSRTMVAVGRIEEIFREKEEENLDTGLTPDLSGDIRFTDVDFAYDTVPVIKKMNMTIKAVPRSRFSEGQVLENPHFRCSFKGCTTRREVKSTIGGRHRDIKKPICAPHQHRPAGTVSVFENDTREYRYQAEISVAVRCSGGREGRVHRRGHNEL
jgi:hypothetical protein